MMSDSKDLPDFFENSPVDPVRSASRASRRPDPPSPRKRPVFISPCS